MTHRRHARTLVHAIAAVLAAALVGLAVADRARADTLEQLFAQANAAYYRGDFADAARGYEAIVVGWGVEDPDVTFNLATAYAKQRRWGHAILWYERTLRLAPGDEAAAAGLTASRTLAGRGRAEAEGEATVETRPPFLQAIVRPFSRNTLAGLLVLLDFAFFGVLLAFRFATRESVRLGLGIAAPLVGLALLAVGVGVVEKRGTLREGVQAIVLTDTELREGPNPWAATRGRATEGATVDLLGTTGGFSRVRLGSGREGWIPARDVGSLE